MITLRPYQSLAVQQIREAFASGARAPLYVAPTGSGKTSVFASIAESSEKRGKRVLILCHRVELVDQIVERLQEFNVSPDIIAAGYSRRCGGRGHLFVRANHSVAVASVQTLVKRLEDYAAPTLIICDEAHHCAGGNTWSTILRAYPTAKVLGVTATPQRLDARGLGAHFDRLIIGPSVRELTAQGYLAPARVFAPPTVDTSGLHIRAGDFKPEETTALMDVPSITGDVLGHYRKLADGLPALAFCVSVAHAHNVADQFRKGGIPALAIDGSTDKQVRRMAVQDFREGTIRVLANCDLFGEGVDLVGCHVGIILRPTMSLALCLQQIGRILRPAPGKSHALILDHVNNVQRHGMPDEDRIWKLTDDTVKHKKTEAHVRICPQCFAATASTSRTCIECGHVFEVKPRQEIKEREGELKEITAEEIARRKARQEQGQLGTLEGLIEFGRKRGYRQPEAWAQHVMAGRVAKRTKEIA